MWQTMTNHRSIFTRECSYRLFNQQRRLLNCKFWSVHGTADVIKYAINTVMSCKWANMLDLKCMSRNSCNVLFSCKMRKLVGGAWYFLNWSQHGCRVFHFTAKQYTTRCFWKHLRREIGITVTEYWFIFDQRCLVWPFDRSLRVIDSCSETARLQLGSDWLFSSGLWNLADAVRSTGGHWGTWFLYLSHALLSGYSDCFIER